MNNRQGIFYLLYTLSVILILSSTLSPYPDPRTENEEMVFLVGTLFLILSQLTWYYPKRTIFLFSSLLALLLIILSRLLLR